MIRPLEYLIGAGIVLTGTAGYVNYREDTAIPSKEQSIRDPHYQSKVIIDQDKKKSELENILVGKWIETDRHHALRDPNKTPIVTGFYIVLNKDGTYERFIDKQNTKKGVYELVPYKNAKGEDKVWINFYDDEKQKNMYHEKGIPAPNPWSISIPKKDEFEAYVPELTLAKYHKEKPVEKDKEKKK